MRRSLLAAGLVFGLVGPSFANSAVTTAWSNMRRAPSGHSRVVQSVPANAEIDLQNCSGDWCYASWRNRSVRFRPSPWAKRAPRRSVAGPPVVVAAPPVVVGPAFGWGGPYVGFGYGWGWRRW